MKQTFASVQRFITTFFALSLLSVHPAFPQATGDVTFYGSIDPRPGSNGSCWGYVTPDGKEYALLGANGGTSIIDIGRPQLQEVSFIPGPSSQWRELKTYLHYAYVVTEGGGGFQIIDLSNPDSARFIRSVTSVGGRNTSRSHSVTLADGYLYLNGGTSPNGGVIILSLLEDPENPTFVGEFTTMYIHDCYVRNDTMYAAAIYNGGGVFVVDVSNKAQPQTLAHISYSGSGTHNTWATVNGKYVYSTDEIGTTTKNMKIWDISSLPAWRSAGSFTPRPGNTIHNVHGRGKYAYISHYGSWMIVADVHNDTIPVERGSYRTSTSGINWGVYPYFPSGKWISSDGQTGLFVCTFSGLLPRTRSPLLSPANSAAVDSAFPLTFAWRAAANQAEDPHYYKLHIFGPGVDTLIRSSDTTTTLPGTSLFQPGEQYRWHVWIMDEYTRVSSADTFQFMVIPNAPFLTTNRDSLDFGTTYVDSTATLPLVVTNIGTQTLLIDSVRSTNSVFTSDFTTTIAIPPDSSDTLSVSYTPPDSGTHTGTLQIFSNSYLQQQKDIALAGSGIPHVARLVTNADSIDFGPVFVDSTLGMTLDISNTGTFPLVIDSVRTTNTVFTSGFIGPVTIPAESTHALQVFFTPDDTGSFVGTLKIFSNAYMLPVKDIALEGRGDPITGITGGDERPLAFRLGQNYPNPFNPTTTIRFTIPQSRFTSLTVYNLLGSEVAMLVNESKEPGEYAVRWDAAGLPSGIYFYRLRAGTFLETRRMVLLK